MSYEFHLFKEYIFSQRRKKLQNTYLSKFRSTNNYKVMALCLDVKLHQNKVVEIKNSLQTNSVSSVDIKEETSLVKIEEIDQLCKLSEAMNGQNYHNDVQDNLVKIEDEIEQENGTNLQDHRKSSVLENSNEIADPNYCKKEEIVPITVGDSFVKEKSECVLLKNNTESETSFAESNFSNKCSDSSNQSSTDLSESCDIPGKIIDTSRPVKGKNKFTEYYIKHYETKVELLDNPDCQRIINMGLSKKEKDRASVLCRECGKTVTFRYYVQVHARAHIGIKPFKCGVCNASFAKEYVLKKHRLVHKDTKNFSCDICGKPFRTSQAAEIHKKSHSDERPYQCNICDKKMKYKETLKQHILTHKNDKTHTCELCGKSFINSAGLIRHKHTHNTEKTFVCVTCDKGFKSKRLLDYHRKLHSDNKPYICSYCDNRFKCNSVLQSHILIHTGEKPFSCKICTKAFRQRPSLRHHMRTHTGETPYACNLCPSKFKYQQQLTNHRKVHKNKSSEK